MSRFWSSDKTMPNALKNANSKRKGHAVIEIALLSPWIFLLFLGVFDFGFYAYAAITTANAARVGALYTSGMKRPDDAVNACPFVLEELSRLPNVTASAACTCPSSTSCSIGPASGTPPAQLTAAVVAGLDEDGSSASRVSVTYQTVQLFPIPGLMGRMNITRTAEMRVKPE